jgi:hypothetical protein
VPLKAGAVDIFAEELEVCFALHGEWGSVAGDEFVCVEKGTCGAGPGCEEFCWEWGLVLLLEEVFGELWLCGEACKFSAEEFEEDGLFVWGREA